MGRIAQLLRCGTSCFVPLLSGFTDLSSIPGLGKIMNVPVFYHEVYHECLEGNNNVRTLVV